MIGLDPYDDGSGCRLRGRIPVVGVPFMYTPGSLVVGRDTIRTKTFPRWLSHRYCIGRRSPVVLLAHESTFFTWFGFAHPSEVGGVVMFRSAGAGLYRALDWYGWPYEVDARRYPSHLPPKQLPPPPHAGST